MIRFSELIKPQHRPDPDQTLNLERLHYVLNVIREGYANSMLVTSGFRTPQENIDLYSRINEKRRAMGQAILPVTTNSMHLRGSAADIYDPKGELQRWIAEHEDLMKDLNVWIEHFSATSTWVHFQIYPPKSMKRFFLP